MARQIEQDIRVCAIICFFSPYASDKLVAARVIEWLDSLTENLDGSGDPDNKSNERKEIA